MEMDPAQLSEPFGARDGGMDLDGTASSEISHQIILTLMTGLIHRNDRAKKHSTPWNEEARFLPTRLDLPRRRYQKTQEKVRPL